MIPFHLQCAPQPIVFNAAAFGNGRHGVIFAFFAYDHPQTLRVRIQARVHFLAHRFTEESWHLAPRINLLADHVYFDLHTGKVNEAELNEAHPDLLDALVEHEGIGLVVTYDETGDPWVLAKNGARQLRSGQVLDKDPLFPYGDPDFRASQLLRLAEFPHAGDLIVISTLYPDGQVAAFEELVGNHGGLGGQQTDAFLFHPADMNIPATSNSSDVYAILNARRGLPGEPLQPKKDTGREPDSWSFDNLAAGMRDVSGMLSRAGRVLGLRRSVFHEVADDPLLCVYLAKAC